MVNTTYHHDALQSVLGQSGHAGTVLATQRYGAFGHVLAQTGGSNNKLKYTGREEDGDTGLYYYRARYYDPALGRFISEDPLGFDSGDVNFYAYVGNNPVNANDPSGNAAKKLLSALDWVIKKFEPGPFAKNGVPLTGPGRQPPNIQQEVNALGNANGCHLCGRTDPGTKSGNWVVDHIPPSALANGAQQFGYPSCISCSQKQGGFVNVAKNWLSDISRGKHYMQYANEWIAKCQRL